MDKTVKQFRKRNAILAYLRETTEHPSAEMVYNHLKPEYPDLSLGTVYRNLAKFKEEGEIMSIGAVNGVERFDGNTMPHVHFVCTGCEAVADLPQIKVPEALNREVTSQTGGHIDMCQLTFVGQCGQCANK
jgi:Fur family peroxide stress response transcriptional regulator